MAAVRVSFAVVNVADGANVDVRLGALKLLLRHWNNLPIISADSLMRPAELSVVALEQVMGIEPRGQLGKLKFCH